MDSALINLLILDVDGVLTDGRVTAGGDGKWAKGFYVQDGCAIKLWQRCGGRVALLSGRSEEVVERRATELGIELVRTGVEDKSSVYSALVASVGCGDAAKRVSMSVTRRRGGGGAVAEVVELLLRKQQRWSRALISSV